MATVEQMIVTCDFTRRSGRVCGKGAPYVATATVGTDSFKLECCPEHHQDVKTALVKLGFQVTSSVDSKPRKGYVAKSGLVFTAQDARPWLLEQGVAAPTGRINTEQIEMYAEAH